LLFRVALVQASLQHIEVLLIMIRSCVSRGHHYLELHTLLLRCPLPQEWWSQARASGLGWVDSTCQVERCLASCQLAGYIMILP